MSEIQPIFVQLIRKPERLCIIKRGKNAEDYFPYCEEVSCDVWGTLMSMHSLCGEPVSMWLPPKYKTPGTSTYVQGVEVETDYIGRSPGRVRHNPLARGGVSDVPRTALPGGRLLRGYTHRAGGNREI